MRDEVSSYDDKYNAYIVSIVLKLYDLAPLQSQHIYEARNGKILSLAETDLKTGDLKLKAQPDILLSSPVKVGTVWEYKTDHGDRIINQIVGFESVTVNAGTFNDVCIVEKSVYGTLPKKSKQELMSVDREYYAPKVGLIKKESIGSAIDNKTGKIKSYKKHKTPEIDLELAKYIIR